MRSRLHWLLACASLLAACSSPRTSTDLRYNTPRATVLTLLDAYGVAEIPQEEVQRRMRIGRRFQLNDPVARDGCFSDFSGEADEGLIGYVFGSLAPIREDFVITQRGADEAMAQGVDSEGSPIRPVILRRGDDGNWRIVLRESVPGRTQRRLESSQ